MAFKKKEVVKKVEAPKVVESTDVEKSIKSDEINIPDAIVSEG